MPEAERPPSRHAADEARARGLVALATRILSTLDSDEVAERIVEGARALFGASRSALLVRDPRARVLAGVAARGISDETVRAARVPEHDADAHSAFREALGFEACACIPLRSGDELAALVVLDGASEADHELAADFAELASIALENARKYRQARLGTALTEGSRAAQELHDTVLQELFAIGVRADELRLGPSAANGEDAVRSIIELSRTAATDVRNAIHVLRSGKPGQAALAPALEQLADELRVRSGLEVELHVAEALAARSDELADVLYRVCAEAFANAERHPHATRCRASCTVEDGWALTVVDHDGNGHEWHHGRIGLAFLGEMVESLGGTLELRNLDRGHPALAARLPLEPAPGLKI
jgi:signal transduction histidine kinase